MNRPRMSGVRKEDPRHPMAGGLPHSYTPMVARYAPGPFLSEQVVIPSEQRWMNARTYIVTDTIGHEYRAVRVLDQSGHFVGYWAVQTLPAALDLGDQFDGDRAETIRQYEDAKEQKARDDRRRRRGKHHD